MSYYTEFEVPADDWSRWRAGECAIDVEGIQIDGTGWRFITLSEYEERIATQTWGERHEDAIEAQVAAVPDMTETEVVDDLSSWYGGRYKGKEPAIYHGMHEPEGNDGITFLSVLGTGGDPLMVLGFGW